MPDTAVGGGRRRASGGERRRVSGGAPGSKAARERGGDRDRPLIIVVGPTAAGKSDLAVFLARHLDGEVVSADALQVYRRLDIGTAKVGPAVRDVVPHHCLDLVDVDAHFSAAAWARAAHAAIAGIRDRGRQPIVAGGSGFYLRALIEGLAPLPGGDRRWRRALQAVESRRGVGHMFEMLSKVDPVWAAAVGPNDRQRILRGLEVTLRLGEPISAVLEREGWPGPHYDAVWIGLRPPRQRLRQRIAERAERMIEAGWVDEVRGLLEDGVPVDAPGLKAIGYREMVAYLRGEMSLHEARDAIVDATRQYAKRQLTWFRRQTPAEWFVEEGLTEALYAKILNRVSDRVVS